MNTICSSFLPTPPNFGKLKKVLESNKDERNFNTHERNFLKITLFFKIYNTLPREGNHQFPRKHFHDNLEKRNPMELEINVHQNNIY